MPSNYSFILWMDLESQTTSSRLLADLDLDLRSPYTHPALGKILSNYSFILWMDLGSQTTPSSLLDLDLGSPSTHPALGGPVCNVLKLQFHISVD